MLINTIPAHLTKYAQENCTTVLWNFLSGKPIKFDGGGHWGQTYTIDRKIFKSSGHWGLFAYSKRSVTH